MKILERKTARNANGQPVMALWRDPSGWYGHPSGWFKTVADYGEPDGHIGRPTPGHVIMDHGLGQYVETVED